MSTPSVRIACVRQVAGPGHAGLGVVGLDRDRVGLAADLEPVLVRGGLLNLGDHPVVGRAEPGQIAGQRVDPADRDGLGAARAGALDAGAARLEQPAGSHNGCTSADRAQQAPSADAAAAWLLPDCTVSSLICNRSPCEVVSQRAGPCLRQPRRGQSPWAGSVSWPGNVRRPRRSLSDVPFRLLDVSTCFRRRPGFASNQRSAQAQALRDGALLMFAWRTAMRIVEKLAHLAAATLRLSSFGVYCRRGQLVAAVRCRACPPSAALACYAMCPARGSVALPRT